MNEKEMIEEMAKDLEMVEKEAYSKIAKETQLFVKEYHRYNSKEDYSLAHTKTIYELVAEALIKIGYTKNKIPEGSVVLTREEYQKYCAYKIIEPQIKGCLDRERELEKQVAELEEQRDRQAYIAEDLIQEKHKWTEQARKETAKEILTKMLANAKRLREQFNSTTYGNNREHLIATIEIEIAGIKNLAKQFGVEGEV